MWSLNTFSSVVQIIKTWHVLLCNIFYQQVEFLNQVLVCICVKQGFITKHDDVCGIISTYIHPANMVSSSTFICHVKSYRPYLRAQHDLSLLYTCQSQQNIFILFSMDIKSYLAILHFTCLI